MAWKGKVAKVPMVMQLEALECGAACLTMILAYYRKWIPLEEVRKDCGVSRDGSNLKNIYLAAQSYGLEPHGYRMELDAVMHQAKFPCIIHWDFNHYVVLDGFSGNKAVLNDPARGIVKVSMEEFNEAFTGIVMTFEPGPNFVPSGKPKSTLAFAAKRLQGAGPAVAFVALILIESYRWFIRKELNAISSTTTATTLGEMRKLQIRMKPDKTWMQLYALTSRQKKLC